MNKKNEICIMEARLVRLASEEFKKTIDCAVDLFEDNGVFLWIVWSLREVKRYG